MLYVATVHYGSPRWIEIQTRHLRQHMSVPFKTWSSLQKIDPSYAVHFDRVIDQWGSHAAKLNHLALEISQVAADSDLLMFLDSDAFPIADPMPLIVDGLARAPLIAVRRAENGNEPQPHPCFCVTTVETWRALGGDWTAGHMWPGIQGGLTSDVGANLLRRLELTKTPWVEVLRSNRRNLDPLYFAVYGDAIYHHGAGSRDAGSRMGNLSPIHRASAPEPLPIPRMSLLRPVTRLVNGVRWRSWERQTERHQARKSTLIFEQLQNGNSEWLADLI